MLNHASPSYRVLNRNLEDMCVFRIENIDQQYQLPSMILTYRLLYVEPEANKVLSIG